MSIIKIFKNFVGDWNITRTLGQYGTVEGVASFTHLDETNLLYKEEIELDCFSTIRAKGCKEYKYSYSSESGESIIKYFYENEATGKIFYELNFVKNNTLAHGTHKCVNDIYQSTYHFHNPNHFILQYKVLGPNKDYTIDSVFLKKYNSRLQLY